VFDPAGYTNAHFDAYLTERDADAIRRMGFDNVRLTVEPAPMFDPASPESLPEAYLARLDAAISMFLARGVAVVVDVHPSDEFKTRLGTDDEHVRAFARFWRAFARHLSRFDPDRVFLELLNEPMVTDAHRWATIQARLVAAAREGAPRHTIIATGANWSSPDELLRVEPVADANVVYAFHFYEPHTFTHQGATWGSPEWKFLTSVPYPSTPEIVAPRLAGVTDERARAALAHYGEERWNAAHVEAEIARAARWARTHRVAVVCNEFGVYRKYAAPAEREAWLRDVRTALERHKIGWAMWDYAGGFAVVDRTDGRTTPDPATVRALGLRGWER
jgi:aryl-phospho-beta-D-glucosidase BglC (GH1 family)